MERRMGKPEVVGRIGLALLSVFIGLPPSVVAAPSGASVVRGNVSIQQQGSRTTITASNRSIINYRGGFDIAANESVRFIQPNSRAWVLNRIISGQRTNIQGALRANGRVALVNQAGVYFGASATVNVNQFVVSGLNISNESFLSDSWQFKGGDGAVINDGQISADRSFFIGRKAVNNGSILAPDGLVVMAAGEEVLIREPSGNVYVEVDGKSMDDLREAAGVARSAPSAGEEAGVKNTGTVAAGSILFGVGDDIAQAFTNTGNVVASTSSGEAGRVEIAAASGTATNSGTIEAKNGSVKMDASKVVSGGTIAANGSDTEVLLGGDTVFVSGTIDVSGGDGGTVEMIGRRVGLTGQINAAASDGGTGGDVTILSRELTAFGSDSMVDASGGDGVGTGGKIIINATEGTTVFPEGTLVDVSGGAKGGDGGFAEISGRGFAGGFFGGSFDLSAADGYRGGDLLIDPTNIVIDTAGGDGSIVTDLFVDIAASNLDSVNTDGGNENGTLNLNAGVNGSFDQGQFGSGSTITLQATESIIVNVANAAGFELAVATSSPNVNLILQSGNTIIVSNPTPGDVGITASGTGSVTLQAEGNITITAPIVTANGDISIQSDVNLFGGAGETSARLEGVPARSFLPKRLVHLEVGLAG